jgi:hypothetical protein
MGVGAWALIGLLPGLSDAPKDPPAPPPTLVVLPVLTECASEIDAEASRPGDACDCRLLDTCHEACRSGGAVPVTAMPVSSSGPWHVAEA